MCCGHPFPLAPSLQGRGDTPASREARYRGYFPQVRCLHVALRRFLNGLKEFGVFDDLST